MKQILLSCSSGKDSAWALHVLRQQGDCQLNRDGLAYCDFSIANQPIIARTNIGVMLAECLRGSTRRAKLLRCRTVISADDASRPKEPDVCTTV